MRFTPSCTGALGKQSEERLQSYTITFALWNSASLSRDGGLSRVDKPHSPKRQSETQLGRKLSDGGWSALGSFSASTCQLYDLGKGSTLFLSHPPGVAGSSQAGKKMKGVDAGKHLSSCPTYVVEVPGRLLAL